MQRWEIEKFIQRLKMKINFERRKWIEGKSMVRMDVDREDVDVFDKSYKTRTKDS